MGGKEFRKTKDVLVAKQNELKKDGKGNKPNAGRMLTDFCTAKVYSVALRQRPLLTLYG